MDIEASRTSATLLEWLRDTSNQRAWAEFAGRYGASIKKWCLRHGLQESDADDVSQNIVIEIREKLQSFHYDPARRGFRSWLHRVTQNACNTFLVRDASRKFRVILEDVAVRTDFEAVMAEEARREMLRVALARVRTQVSERDWQVFYGLTHQGLSGAEVAAAYEIKIAAAYMIRHRVLAKLKLEVDALGGDLEGEEQWS